MAFLAKPGPIAKATSRPVTGLSKDRTLPSGSVKWDIRKPQFKEQMKVTGK
jgi:hypothetical protein